MSQSNLLATLSGLSSAEEFFTTLGVPFDEHVVHVNRLHILKRYRDYVANSGLDDTTADDAALHHLHAEALSRAHSDFTASNAVEQKVFKVFQQVQGRAMIGLDAIEPLSTDR